MERLSKIEYYLSIAHSVALRGTCLRRNFGAVIINKDEIVSTGYAGAPRGRKNCIDMGVCTRQKLNIPAGERYELCRSVHGEANAIISAARRDMIDGTLYLVGIDKSTGEVISNSNCCAMCKRQVINAGIKDVVIRDPSVDIGYRIIQVRDWIFDDDSLTDHSGY